MLEMLLVDGLVCEIANKQAQVLVDLLLSGLEE
jgi:hypothetical protein